jgi:hypothetical protein
MVQRFVSNDVADGPQCRSADCSWDHPGDRPMAIDVGMESPVLDSGHLLIVVHHRSAFHVSSLESSFRQELTF